MYTAILRVVFRGLEIARFFRVSTLFAGESTMKDVIMNAGEGVGCVWKPWENFDPLVLCTE
jgi:hypothetical protein